MTRTTLEMHLKSAHGEPPRTMRVSWCIDEEDASCWRQPCMVTIEPYYSFPGPKGDDEVWETVVDLSREDMRVLRDFLTLLLGSPDLRQD